MSEPGQHSGGAGEAEMSGVLGQLERLMRAYNDLAGKRQGQGTQIVPDTDVPRSMFLEIESWDPDEPGALPVTAFFQMFDDVAGTLTQVKKMRLLRAKTKGTAKQFLIDNAQSHAGLNPYDEARQAMLAWFETENPVKAAASLCAARVSQGEGLRQFAERVHRLARSAVKEEGPDLTNVQKQNWIRRKTLRAFVKGLPRELGSLLTNNPPETLEAALKRAEELRETLDLESDDDAKWGVSAVTVREERRCYECGVPGEAALAVQGRDREPQELRRVARVEIPVTEPDPEVLVAVPNAEIPVTKPDPEVLVAVPNAEIPVTKPDPEVLVAVPNAEIPVTRPDPAAFVAVPNAEIPVTKSDPEVLVAVPNVEIPVTTPDPKGTIKGNDPEMARGSDAVEAGIRMGHPVTHWPSGDVGFRRVGAIVTGKFSDFEEDAEEFPIERWDREKGRGIDFY
ncbi:hypothetical protein GE061_003693 [Apolygus lucorum]|uniref:Uncharacterized protein n=1 Tax=Apolygus lucorum TaxID=248454 RepID=A0A8S9X6T4_APOLU|nr:hypothetical protein GE061_003693 [Apolygus lucorum]